MAGLYGKSTCLLAIRRGLLDNTYLDDSDGDENEQATELDLGEGRTGLQKALRLTSHESWLNWLKSPLVKPYWIELWDNCLKYVKRKGRGVSLETVQEHLVRGEVGGQQRFSALTLDKQGWDEADHLARFLWAVKHTNETNHEGVFFRRNVSDDEKEKAVWKVYTILKDDLMEITPEKLEELEQIQQSIDNLDYQRENHLKACQNLGIEDPECPRLPGMVTSAVLKFWQPVGIWAIVEIMIEKVAQGALLADAVGLGKTWQSVGIILAVSDPGDLERLKKPILVLVPPHLIYQWQTEILSITKQLALHVYYGETRSRKDVRQIDGKLTADHEIFTKQGRRPTVVLSSYNTFESRHGVSGVKAWYMYKYKSKLKGGENCPKDYPNNIEGCFGLIILDEAHNLRNETSGISQAVWWARGDFNLLLTATPFFN
ncbi:P-loop containing nucleoside triphosphate hydrolase protein, partial [Aspergillus ellipticus CBS 707.79]